MSIYDKSSYLLREEKRLRRELGADISALFYRRNKKNAVDPGAKTALVLSSYTTTPEVTVEVRRKSNASY